MRFTFVLYKNKRINFNVIISVILSIIIIHSLNTIAFATNLVSIKNNFKSLDIITKFNLLADSSNYNFKEIEELDEYENNIDYEATESEIAMDEVVKNKYSDILVFNNIKDTDIQVIVENNNYQKLKVCGIEVTNYSSNRNIDFKKIISMEDKVFSKYDEVTMYTTHTSESYANSKEYSFEYSAPARCLDGNYNMLSIASTLARNLNSKGINTVCSLNPHDYGEYNSAYTNSRITLSSIINENPNVKIAIDVHRDAIEDLSFAPKLDIMGYNVACVMLVMGIGYSDEPNPYYEQNLKLAFEIQMLAEKIYPGLFRPMIIRDSVYNQDLMPNSFLIEVGATGNTIDEAKLATRCLSNLLNIIYNH